MMNERNDLQGQAHEEELLHRRSRMTGRTETNKQWIRDYIEYNDGGIGMSLISRETGGGDFEITPQGNHLGICYLLVDLGNQQTNFGIKEQVMIGWELPNKLMIDGRPFVISKVYTNSLSEKANLRQDLESWRGCPFTEKELEGFDLTNIMGAPCMVNVVHNKKETKIYANVKAITSVPEGINIPNRTNDMVAYDMDSSSELAFNKLPEWMQKKIMAAVEVPKDEEEYNELNPPLVGEKKKTF